MVSTLSSAGPAAATVAYREWAPAAGLAVLQAQLLARLGAASLPDPMAAAAVHLLERHPGREIGRAHV